MYTAQYGQNGKYKPIGICLNNRISTRFPIQHFLVKPLWFKKDMIFGPSKFISLVSMSRWTQTFLFTWVSCFDWSAENEDFKARMIPKRGNGEYLRLE